MILSSEPLGDHMMIGVRPGTGQGLADKVRQTLTKGVVPTLHLRRFIAFLAHSSMGFFGKTPLIGLPKIAETTTAFVGIWNLATTATHSGLQSALMVLLNTKDHSIYFQHSGTTGSSVFFRSGKVPRCF